MRTTKLDELRNSLRNATLADESTCLHALLKTANLTPPARRKISTDAATLINSIRSDATAGLMEVFLSEYGLSTDEGIALMCLAEALLRVPDADTIDALIEDKIAPSNWGTHLGLSASSLVNASTWALMLTGKVLDDRQPGLAGTLRHAIKRLGEPVIRSATGRAMREMGRQFVLGQTIDEAATRAGHFHARGYTYSYDMLGEAARTEADARRYHLAYSDAISQLARHVQNDDIRANPGISVKLSALHPRYEMAQHARVMDELVPRAKSLALLAKSAGMGFNIDAEESDRLDLSLDVIKAILSDAALANWDGFGVVVQAYGQRAPFVLDWLYSLADKLDRKIMVRLVKGAYWDTEIKRAQTLGLSGFPVFTRKDATDVSYMACARKLLGMTDRIYPQFATHNAHTVTAILAMAGDSTVFEFQRLHGMGEALHEIVRKAHNTRCRIYAPVGAHRDLLAYLVRRLLENGANSSFVNQIVDHDIPAEEVATDPFAPVLKRLKAGGNSANPRIARPAALFGKTRHNSQGFDLTSVTDLAEIEAARSQYRSAAFTAEPVVAGEVAKGKMFNVTNPADPGDCVGRVRHATPMDVQTALGAARIWKVPPQNRAKILNAAADLFQNDFGAFYALACREAGKTLNDAEGELREAIDFIRYYANQALEMHQPPRGTIACISPWNFPLAIFTGQIVGALAAGNAVIAKPAESTPLIAAHAIKLLLRAGVPRATLQFLPGKGAVVGTALSTDAHIDGMCFTGSLPTAQTINRTMAENLAPDAPLIAETGGLNAMIVDSTALFEAAIRDILASAFQSAGQRCSALRVLYLQEDIAPDFLNMLTGAMDELALGDPWAVSTDVGPVIDAASRQKILAHIGVARDEGRLIKHGATPSKGHFVSPALIRIDGIADLQEEIFGPVLHVATFKSGDFNAVLDAINASGFGLTFGLHTRIDGRVQHCVDRLNVGNIYVNRDQIGAVVGSQPFGGEGLSGTGPKAGGPNYLRRLVRNPVLTEPDAPVHPNESVDPEIVEKALAALENSSVPTVVAPQEMPGPTGESNRLSTVPRGRILCLGPTLELARSQADHARQAGCTALTVAVGGRVDGVLAPQALTTLTGFDTVACFGPNAGNVRKALAARPGPIVPLITSLDQSGGFHIERHICVDTTAAGGNAALLAGAS